MGEFLLALILISISVSGIPVEARVKQVVYVVLVILGLLAAFGRFVGVSLE